MHLGGRQEGERGGDDFVARADTQGQQAEQEGLGAAGDGDAMLCTGVGLEALFEFAHLRPHDVLAVLQHRIDTGLDLRLQCAILGLEVDEGDAHLLMRSRV